MISVKGKWRATLDFSGFWDGGDADPEDRVNEIKQGAVKAINEFISTLDSIDKEHYEVKFILRPIRERFRKVTTIDGFDNIMNDLYNWGDVKRVWIKTRF